MIDLNLFKAKGSELFQSAIAKLYHRYVADDKAVNVPERPTAKNKSNANMINRKREAVVHRDNLILAEYAQGKTIREICNEFDLLSDLVRRAILRTGTIEHDRQHVEACIRLDKTPTVPTSAKKKANLIKATVATPVVEPVKVVAQEAPKVEPAVAVAPSKPIRFDEAMSYPSANFKEGTKAAAYERLVKAVIQRGGEADVYIVATYKDTQTMRVNVSANVRNVIKHFENKGYSVYKSDIGPDHVKIIIRDI